MFISNFLKTCAIICITTTLLSANKVAEVVITQDAVIFKVMKNIEKYSLFISGPNTYTLEESYNGADALITSFAEDGLYKYELIENPKNLQKQLKLSDLERNSQTHFTPQNVGKKQYGHFRTKAGKPVQVSKTDEE